MKDIPLQADVRCKDGAAGHSTTVIVDPGTLRVTHIVVKEKQSPHADRLVPVDLIAESRPDLIRLDCSLADLSRLKEFTRIEYRQLEIPRYDGVRADRANVPEIVTTDDVVELVPEGELALHKGADVEATDGRVGEVADLLLDPGTGKITSLVLREKHLWGSQDVLLPVAMVDRVVKDTVYLTLDTDAISSMLGIPARWRARGEGLELVTFSAQDPAGAKAALKALKGVAKDDGLQILNAAVLVKDRDGKTSLQESEDVDAKHGALFGAVTGGLIGLLGGPVGVVVGAAAGAAVGGVAADKIDMGFPDEYLEKLQAGLQPGSSALVVLVEQEGVEKATEILAEFDGQVLCQALSGDIVDRLGETAA